MFEYIRGEVAHITPTFVVIETGGIGYYFHITLNTYTAVQAAASQNTVKIFAHSVIREDAHLLFGFFEESERQLFRQLITVSGIGANTARMMLSSMSPAELTSTIAHGDADALKAIKGIGLKTAQRIIVELKDKIGSSPAQKELFAPSNNTVRDEALSALVMLGFPKKAVETVVGNELRKNGEMSVEELIKTALKQL
jgi:Holliday junction DNA helicase RuvA